jgi:Flp pilus assembly protein TadG
MRPRQPTRRVARRRPGNVLASTVLLMPVLLGMVGLALDGGMMMAVHRQAQNAADAGAVAAAWDKLRGRSASVQSTTATTYVTNYNGLSTATVAFNAPPQSGPYSGNVSYLEVIVTVPIRTMFIQVLGTSKSQQVQARAVAGIEAVAAGEGAIVLDPTARPGMSVQGGGNLVVNGRVVVNAEATGYAATTGNGSNVQATDIQVVGQVDTPANYQSNPVGGASPLHTGALPEPDPLISLPTPVSGMAGVDVTARGSITASGTYSPGIYSNISLGNGTNVTFNPGIYIMVPQKPNDGISITGGAIVSGTGVMFYLTGDNFKVATGLPDANDGSSSPPDASGAKNYASLTINGNSVNLTGLTNASSPFNGMLFYQRRLNTSGANIQGNGSNTQLGGTIYAKWAQFKVSGSGQYNAQFVVGSMAISGQADVTLNYAGKNLGKANQVYLVE